MFYNFSRGSQWNKWDLHIHTPASYLNNQYGSDWDSYVRVLFNTAIQKEIKVIGITDYFTIEGYKKIRNEYLCNEEKLKSVFSIEITSDVHYLNKVRSILLLPNIEFRLDQIVSTKGNGTKPRRINYHVIFSSEVSINDIEENFLHDLEFTYQGNEMGLFEKRKLKVSNIEELGKRLKVEHGFFRDKTDIFIGCSNAVVSLEQICKILVTTGSKFKDKYLLIYAEEDMSNISWNGQDHLVRKNIMQVSNMIFCSNEKTREIAITDEFEKEFRGKKPCIWGSDAHSPEELFNPKEQKYLWIKADPTFYGLKQLLYEPNDRVYIGLKPGKLDLIENNPSNYIRRLKINPVEGYLKTSNRWFNNDIELNENLIAIIGNKGSGKSALADVLGFTGGSKNYDYFSFLNPTRFKRKPDNFARYFESNITWNDGTSINKSLSEIGDPAEIERVKYLPQNYIEKICNDLGDGFETEINNMVFSYLSEEDKLKSNTFDELLEYLCEGIDNELSIAVGELSKINQSIIRLEDKNNKDYKANIFNKMMLKVNELKNHMSSKPNARSVPIQDSKTTEEINGLDSKIMELEQQIQIKGGELKQVTLKIEELKRVNEKVTMLRTEYDKAVSDIDQILKTSKIEININLQLSYDLSVLESLLAELESERNSLRLILEKEETKYTDLSLNKQLNAIKKQKNTMSGKLSIEQKEYHDYLQQLKNWGDKKQQIIGDEETMDTIKFYAKENLYLKRNLENDLNKWIAERNDYIKKIYNYKNKKVNVYKKLYSPVMQYIGEIDNSNKKDDLKFSVHINYESNFEEKFLGYINQSISSLFKGKVDGSNNLRELLSNYNFDNEDDILKFVTNIYSEIIKDSFEESTRLGKLIKNRLEVYNYIFSLDYLKVEYKLKLSDKPIEQLSPGERGLLLLIFYLVLDKDKCPLIIDQPEDNLDNQSVYEKLVPYIKRAKGKRQVIIVTHNPNIAIACDAEQIIYCSIQKENNEIIYESGSLENPQINNHSVNVLEGTIPAFNLRDIKYIR